MRTLLAQNPDAVVAAINDDGLFVVPPEGLPFADHRVATARSALDLVMPGDMTTVVSTWHQTLLDGAAMAEVTLAAGGGARATIHFYDLRPTAGVLAGVLVPTGEVAPDAMDQIAAISLRPRLCRVRKSQSAVLVDVDDDFTAMLGWERDDVVGRRSLEFVHPDDHETAISTWMEVLTHPGGTCRSRVRHLAKDGTWLWVEISNHNMLNEPGIEAVDCEMFDISKEMEAHEALRASEQLLRRLAEALPVGVAQFNTDGELVYVNDRLLAIVGAVPGAPVDGPTLRPAVVDQAALDAALAEVAAGGDVDVEMIIDRLDGTGRRRCSLSMRALTGPTGDVTGAVCCLTDITEAAQMRAELERRATYDALTGAVNRMAAVAAVDAALADRTRDVAVVFVDLDDFKGVNDRYGHRTGDAVLVAVTARLRQAVRSCDVVGRLGGDEFLVVCGGVGSEGEARDLGHRVLAALHPPVEVDDLRLELGASVGVAWAPVRRASSSGNGTDPVAEGETLIAEADAAMYTAKHRRDGQPVLAVHAAVHATATADRGTAVSGSAS